LLSRTPFNEKVRKENVAMRHKYMLFAFILVLTAGVALAVEETKRAFSYDDYDAVLKDHVDDTGMVNYRQLKAKPARLDAFIADIGKLNTKSYDIWNNNEKVAFWLNTYNALTLKVIIDNYPIKSSFFRSRIYPKNSIRQIAGVWNKIKFNVLGQDLTLGHIEHEILRKKFNEPRIHMSMVCAAMGCPSLRNEPYIGKKLDKQLDDQGRKFLANPNKFSFDSNRRILYISPIFKWFNKDFVAAIPEGTNCAQYSEKEAAILGFVSKYLSQDHPCFSQSIKAVKIKYLKYDWSLNEQKIEDKKSKESRG
jgi:hypothetical protein